MLIKTNVLIRTFPIKCFDQTNDVLIDNKIQQITHRNFLPMNTVVFKFVIITDFIIGVLSLFL